MNIRSECWRQILVCWSLQDLRICLKKTSWVDQFYRYLVSCLSKGCISSPLIWCEFSKLVNVCDIIGALLEFWSNIDGSWWISITWQVDSFNTEGPHICSSGHGGIPWFLPVGTSLCHSFPIYVNPEGEGIEVGPWGEGLLETSYQYLSYCPVV